MLSLIAKNRFSNSTEFLCRIDVNLTIFLPTNSTNKINFILSKFLYLTDVYLFRKIIKNSGYYFRKEIRTLQLAKLQSWIKLLITSVMSLFVKKNLSFGNRKIIRVLGNFATLQGAKFFCFYSLNFANFVSR